MTADYIVVSKINNLTSRVNKEKLLGETVKINSVKADLLIILLMCQHRKLFIQIDSS